MMIKEQYTPPAARYDNMSEAELEAALAKSGKDWTVMIRDASGSKDGWYWSEVYSGMSSDASSAHQAPKSAPPLRTKPAAAGPGRRGAPNLPIFSKKVRPVAATP